MKKQNQLWQSARKILAIAAVLLIAATASAQTSQTHIVKRGETFASIASKYGITESELRTANPNAKNCYAGTKLNIVKKAPVLARAETGTNITRQSTYVLNNLPETELNLSRRLIGNKKYKKASKYLNHVMQTDLSTPQQKEEARSLLAEIEQKKEERRERWADALGNLADGLKETGNSLMAAGAMASQMDAIQRGAYVSNRPPIPTFNNPPSSNSMGGPYDPNLAAEMGKAEAEKKLAEIHQKVEKEEAPYYKGLDYYNAGNYTEAFKWIKQAAEAGIVKAQYKLGDMYAEGKGVEKNETIANRWYRQADETMRNANEMLRQNQAHINDMMRQSNMPETINSSTAATSKTVCSVCLGSRVEMSNHLGCNNGGCVFVSCNICRHRHCIRAEHKTCSSCKGRGEF